MADRIGQIWGEDNNGELANMFKRSRKKAPGFMAGSLAQAHLLEYLALQIKAAEEGLIDTPYPGWALARCAL